MIEFEKSESMQMLASGKLSLEHYKSILCEVFHYTKENPQLQALASVSFRGKDRQLVRNFLGHASSEIGHDQLALNDLTTLGGKEAAILVPRCYPLPATTALTAYAFYCIQQRAPIGYLGYLYFLEFMPTGAGNKYSDLLLNAGVPKKAMTFLSDHISIDVAHNKLMKKYLKALVHNPDDSAAICYSIRTTGYLYSSMLYSAITRAESDEKFIEDPLETGRMGD